MASMENPLPGMNPFLELRWRDAHTALIGYIREALSEELPADLSVQAEEHLVVTFPDEDRDRAYFADVAVCERWKNGLPPLWQPEGEGAKAIQVAEPEIILAEPATERWLEIRDRDGRLVTALELLSPWNKENPGREEYRRKQTVYRESRVNLVEIDLLRGFSPFSSDIRENFGRTCRLSLIYAKLHGFRIARSLRNSFALSSPMNCSATGSHFSLRPSSTQRFPMWQTVATR